MATTVTNPVGTETLESVGIVDCDAHFTEPPSLWLDRAPAALKDRVPVQKTVDGITAWYLDGELWASIGGNTIKTGREKILGSHVAQPFDVIDRSAWDVEARLGLLDAIGVEAQILYPNGIGFASNHIFAIEDIELRSAILTMYNDFFVDVQAESHNRLFPQAILPVWDMDFTIREMNRLLDKGMRGFTLSDKPEMIGLPELPEPYFAPMWDLFNESGAVANFHIGSGARREEMEAIRGMRNRPREDTTEARPIPAVPAFYWHSFGNQRRLAVHASQMFMSNVRIVVNLCMSDMFDRYPKLKIVSAESGIGWVPFILETLEYQLDEMITEPDEVSYQQRRPSEYFRDHLYVMFWYENVGPTKLIEDIGVNNVLVETDVPHPTCLYPGAKEHFDTVLGHLSPDVRRRVLRDNAAELYQIPVGVTRG
jgi:predicted TIM-barrel fold metal-dependent hydrolase